MKPLSRWTVQPHGPLEQAGDDILTVQGEIVMPLGRFPRRMTVVRLAAGGTAIYSAIALHEPEMARIEALGRPAFLIVPSAAHRLDAAIWKQRYPAIRVLTPPGARAKVEEIVAVEATDDILGDPAIAFRAVPGTDDRESSLLIDRAGEASLILNDVLANVAHPPGPGARIMARLFGFGLSHPETPRLVRRMIVDDRRALAAAFREWAALPTLRRVIVSHGDVIDRAPADVLRAAAARLDS